MTLTFPTIGQDPWGAVLNALLTRIAGDPVPDDRGLITWAYPPTAVREQANPATGVLQVSRIQIRTAATITNLVTSVAVAGVTLTAGQNFMALYDSTGARVGVTADQTAAWGTAGNKTAALTVPYAAAAGFYWVAHLSNGTTAPQFLRTFNNPSGINNLGVTAATAFAATTGAGLTATPASFVPAALTLSLVTYFAAVS